MPDMRHARPHIETDGNTGEGRVFVVKSDDGRLVHLVGISCETDFLAGSDKFKEFRSALDALEPEIDGHSYYEDLGFMAR